MIESIDWTEVAKEAYRAYGETTDFKNYQGLPMPEWDDLTPAIKSAWESAVIRAVEFAKENEV